MQQSLFTAVAGRTGAPPAASSEEVGEGITAWSVLSSACALVALFAGEFSSTSFYIALPFLVVGGLFAATSLYTLGLGQELVTRGPYRWTRHPFLFGILTMLLGAIIMMRSLPALLVFFAVVWVTLLRARREEHNLVLRCGPAYLEYRSRVPRLVPWPPTWWRRTRIRD